MPLLILIYSMMWQLICKYKPFWQEVSVESLILRCPLSPLDLLYNFSANFFRAWLFSSQILLAVTVHFNEHICLMVTLRWNYHVHALEENLKKNTRFSKKILETISVEICTRSAIFFCFIPSLTQRILEWGGADWILLNLKKTSFYNGKKNNETRWL